MHRLTATDTPMVRYTRTIFPSYADFGYPIHFTIRESYKLKCDELNAYDGKTIKRYPRLRCMKTERDTDLNIYISSKLMSIPVYTKILKDYSKFINKESNGLQPIYSMFDSIIFYTIFHLYF